MDRHIHNVQCVNKVLKRRRGNAESDHPPMVFDMLDATDSTPTYHIRRDSGHKLYIHDAYPQNFKLPDGEPAGDELRMWDAGIERDILILSAAEAPPFNTTVAGFDER